MTNLNGNRFRNTNEGMYAASGVWGLGELDMSRHAALSAFKGDALYAARIGAEVVKIGFTSDMSARVRTLACRNEAPVEILAFRLDSSYAEEQAIHAALKPHRAWGHEYYHPTPEVLAVVNDMRDDFGLPHLAA